MHTIAYLDNNATTRPDPRVIEAMRPFLTEQYGNPSSTHHFGASVAAHIEEARNEVAGLLGARASEIVFTSGGTESNNAALRGVTMARPRRRHVIISAVEHHAILEPAGELEREGIRVTRIGVNRDGALHVDQVRETIGDDTALVSIMLANNETGVIFPIRDVVEIARSRGVLVHTDAVNALGKVAVDVERLGVDLVSVSAHKVHGVKGCGALYVRRGTPLRPFILGGPQEQQRRGGTHNVAGIVAFGAACRLLRMVSPTAGAGGDSAVCPSVSALRDRLEREVTQRFDCARVIGAASPRVGNTSCICFAGLAAEPIVMLLSEAGVCVSSGAACSSGSLEPSHVLAAMGIEPEVAQGQVRFSLSRYSTEADVDRVLDVLPGVLAKVAALNS